MAMDFPNEYKYTKDHEWISTPKNNVAKVGVTSYAVEQLGDIVHIELPEVGEEFEVGAGFGTIESTKTVSDLYMPAGGKILEVNKAILNSPEKLQDDCYADGWLIKIQVTDENESKLLDASDYETFIAEQED